MHCLRFRLQLVGRPGAQLLDDRLHRPFARGPAREPRADVAAAGDGGDVVELVEDTVGRALPEPGQPLDDAQREAGAADAAAGEAERRALLLVQQRNHLIGIGVLRQRVVRILVLVLFEQNFPHRQAFTHGADRSL
jgi:hypothetical protein